VAKLALAFTYATEVKPEGDERFSSERFKDADYHVIIHTAAEEWVRMTDYHCGERLYAFRYA
jgi:hypothetical protein